MVDLDVSFSTVGTESREEGAGSSEQGARSKAESAQRQTKTGYPRPSTEYWLRAPCSEFQDCCRCAAVAENSQL
jgi:hypothetical protein